MKTTLTNPPQSVLIVGASRGIGAGFIEALAQDSRVETIICAARTASTDERLQTLSNKHAGRIALIDLDLTDESSIARAVKLARERVSSLDWLINTVGLLHAGPDLQPERRLADVNVGNIQQSFAVNSIGPLLLAKHFAALMPRRTPCTFATLSARVGSISDNKLGGWYAYRASKAAQNMLTKTLSIELKRTHRQIRVIALHPGTVATDLSEPFRGNVSDQQLFSVEQCTNYLLSILDKLDENGNGKFFAWDGQEIAW